MSDTVRIQLQPSPYLPIMLKLGAAEFHWHFVQGLQVLEKEFYIPGITCLLAGIEASIRVTMHQLQDIQLPEADELGATLSNKLLRSANDVGLPIDNLAFPDEADFNDKLNTNRNHVAIVRTRHDLAHGNVLSYLNRDLGEDNVFFTPECLRDLSEILVPITLAWIDALADFRSKNLAA